jgi:hypothetical protein
VRREIVVAYCDLKGKSLLSCRDVEISYVARCRGFGTGVFPEFRLVHLSQGAPVHTYLLDSFAYILSTANIQMERVEAIVPSNQFYLLQLKVLSALTYSPAILRHDRTFSA